MSNEEFLCFFGFPDRSWTFFSDFRCFVSFFPNIFFSISLNIPECVLNFLNLNRKDSAVFWAPTTSSRKIGNREVVGFSLWTDYAQDNCVDPNKKIDNINSERHAWQVCVQAVSIFGMFFFLVKTVTLYMVLDLQIIGDPSWGHGVFKGHKIGFFELYCRRKAMRNDPLDWIFIWGSFALIRWYFSSHLYTFKGIEKL